MVQDIKESYSKSYHEMKLYLDDINEIFKILESTFKDSQKEVKITSGLKIYDLTERDIFIADNKDKTLYGLKIEVMKPYFWISLTRYDAKIFFTQKYDPVLTGVALQIGDIFNRRRRLFLFLNHWLFNLIGGVITGIGLLLIISGGLKLYPTLLAIFLLLISLIQFIYQFYVLKKHVVITLTKQPTIIDAIRSEWMSDLIKKIISAGVIALVSFSLGYLTKQS
jgi:hypothetical protein